MSVIFVASQDSGAHVFSVILNGLPPPPVKRTVASAFSVGLLTRFQGGYFGMCVLRHWRDSSASAFSNSIDLYGNLYRRSVLIVHKKESFGHQRTWLCLKMGQICQNSCKALKSPLCLPSYMSLYQIVQYVKKLMRSTNLIFMTVLYLTTLLSLTHILILSCVLPKVWGEIFLRMLAKQQG